MKLSWPLASSELLADYLDPRDFPALDPNAAYRIPYSECQVDSDYRLKLMESKTDTYMHQISLYMPQYYSSAQT